jgi:hypothetical protein
MKDEKCIYFKNGDCSKGLAGTPCEVNGCVAHTDKVPENAFIEKAVDWLRKGLDGGMWVDQFLSNSDKNAILTSFKEWMEDDNWKPDLRYKIDVSKSDYETIIAALEDAETLCDEHASYEDQAKYRKLREILESEL